MKERRFAVIGHPIGHTMSPFIHKRLFELAGERGEYILIDIAPEELPVRIKELDELCGYNITIPNKQRIIPFLDSLDKKAELYGSVNTVKNGNTRTGYTTDPDGFLKALQYADIPFRGDVVLVGCGGVARTFAYEAVLAGCSLTVAARPEDAVMQKALADDIKKKLNCGVECCSIAEIKGEHDLLINATPVGMYPNVNDMVVSKQALSKCAAVFDAVYNPLDTMLLQAARANGSRAAGGMSMLVWQAVAAHEIWDGTVYKTDEINQLIEDSAEEMTRKFC